LYNAADIPCIELYTGLKRQLTMLGNEYAWMISGARQLLDALAAAVTPANTTRRGAGGGGAALNILPAVGALAAPGPVLAGYAAGAVLRTAIDLAALFRVDTDYKNFDLQIDDMVLAAEFKKVLPNPWKLWYPAQFPVNTVANIGADTSELLDTLTQVEKNSTEAASLSARLSASATELTAALATEPDPVNRRKGQDQVHALTGALDAIKAVDAGFAQVQGLLAGVDPTAKVTTTSLLLRAERLLAVMKKADAYVVKLAAVSRGSNKVTKWLWSSAKIRHSAGSELNCLIFDPAGEVVFSDTELCYTPYRLPGEIGESL
jgi:hypothetical protein